MGGKAVLANTFSVLSARAGNIMTSVLQKFATAHGSLHGSAVNYKWKPSDETWTMPLFTLTVSLWRLLMIHREASGLICFICTRLISVKRKEQNMAYNWKSASGRNSFRCEQNFALIAEQGKMAGSRTILISANQLLALPFTYANTPLNHFCQTNQNV